MAPPQLRKATQTAYRPATGTSSTVAANDTSGSIPHARALLASPGTAAPVATVVGRAPLALLIPQPVSFAEPDGPSGPPPLVIAGAAPAPLPTAKPQRWAVQLLAGPALTYRHLSPGATPQIASNSVVVTNQARTAELERPTLGGGVQASLRYTLTQQLDLRTGLGYTEFATRLALQLVRAATMPAGLDSATSIHRRDTYRFLVVPVRLGYGRSLSARWRVSVLGGVDAAFYLGGTTTEESACPCQPRSWGPTGSPYRTFSMAASLGGEVRYQLNGRWALLAQPTATYLLSPLSKAPTTYTQRHLFGATALLGAAWILP